MEDARRSHRTTALLSIFVVLVLVLIGAVTWLATQAPDGSTPSAAWVRALVD